MILSQAEMGEWYRRGALCLAIMGICIGLMGMFFILPGTVDLLRTNGPLDELSKAKDEHVGIVVTLVVLVPFVFATQLLVSVLLLIGVYRAIPSLMLLYITCSFYPRVILAVAMALYSFLTKGWLSMVCGLIPFAMDLYLLWAVYCHYKEVCLSQMRLQLAEEV